ncbi:BnaC01g19410D [Brassica napus]|uniref:(rape) hypothetical protein n=1 Tax=Brassica napus TaxID=3708 RepID=A0A078GVV2_BRANA|nr:unnamed protein product [Brassica napus]CDY29289.1 BnaC01g19410D [Brassica napus]
MTFAEFIVSTVFCFPYPKVGSEIGSWSVLAEAVMSNDASSLGVREPLMDLGDVGEMVILLVFSDLETDSEIGSRSSLAEAVCREAKTSFEILESFGEPEVGGAPVAKEPETCAPNGILGEAFSGLFYSPSGRSLPEHQKRATDAGLDAGLDAGKGQKTRYRES